MNAGLEEELVRVFADIHFHNLTHDEQERQRTRYVQRVLREFGIDDAKLKDLMDAGEARAQERLAEHRPCPHCGALIYHKMTTCPKCVRQTGWTDLNTGMLI